MTQRLSSGVPGLDRCLGGGLLPGTLTAVVGATGIGKTQLGVQFAHAGRQQEGPPGIIFDMTSRGDSQSHGEYAQRMFDWSLTKTNADERPKLETFFEQQYRQGDYLHVFDYHGRRVTRNDVDEEAWRLWQSELMNKLAVTIAFFYGAFTRGVRRCVIDGLEPADHKSNSIQLQLLEYVYHQILRKDPEWVARDLFRQLYRTSAAAVAEHVYNPAEVGCLVMYTSHESMLDDLISRPLDEGDLLAGANTVIYLGKTREGNRLGRGLYIAKHRGSACSDEILPYEIGDAGVYLS